MVNYFSGLMGLPPSFQLSAVSVAAVPGGGS
jgi:hypothetical protein